MCEFWLKHVAFLGHVVSSEGVSMDPAKIEIVTSWPRPFTVSEIRRFLGLAGYYKRFMEYIFFSYSYSFDSVDQERDYFCLQPNM